jgi:hypothetical protein
MVLTMLRNIILLFAGTLIFGGAIGFYLGYDLGFERAEEVGISSFEECRDAGNPVMETYPEQCTTEDGMHFVREIEPVEEETEELPVVNPPTTGGPITPEEPRACTMDAKECPDGSYVGRVAPSCAFAPCP